MLKFVAAAFAALALSSFAAAQNCSDLTLGGSGAPGGTVTVDLTGATANAPTFLFIGTTTGSTSIAVGPLGTLDLGLEMPFAVFPAGSTDGNGALSLSLNVPPGQIPQTTLHVQATSIGFRINRGAPPSIGFCTSDVESVTIG